MPLWCILLCHTQHLYTSYILMLTSFDRLQLPVANIQALCLPSNPTMADQSGVTYMYLTGCTLSLLNIFVLIWPPRHQQNITSKNNPVHLWHKSCYHDFSQTLFQQDPCALNFSILRVFPRKCNTFQGSTKLTDKNFLTISDTNL